MLDSIVLEKCNRVCNISDNFCSKICGLSQTKDVYVKYCIR